MNWINKLKDLIETPCFCCSSTLSVGSRQCIRWLIYSSWCWLWPTLRFLSTFPFWWRRLSWKTGRSEIFTAKCKSIIFFNPFGMQRFAYRLSYLNYKYEEKTARFSFRYCFLSWKEPAEKFNTHFMDKKMIEKQLAICPTIVILSRIFFSNVQLWHQHFLLQILFHEHRQPICFQFLPGDNERRSLCGHLVSDCLVNQLEYLVVVDG